MATPNVGILTNAGKNLIDQVNAGQTKITFSKIAFSSMDNSRLTDDQVKALTTVVPQEIVVNNPEVTLDNNTGETRIRATGTNEALKGGVYVKTYAVYAKDGSANEILYGLTVSPNPNYFPAYDGVTPQAVTYSYKVNISNTSNITFANSNDIYVSETDLAEAVQPYAKTVDVNQQLDKKVTDNKDGTEQLNGVKVQPFNKLNDTIGGRNLLINTAQLNDSTVCLNKLSNISDTYLGLNIYQTNTPWDGLKIYWPYLAPKLKTNTNYVMSEYVRNTSPTKAAPIGTYGSDTGVVFNTDINYFVATLPPNSGWTRISALVNIASFPTTISGTLRFENATTLTDGYVQFAGLKFEQGSIATDWTPAPEDKADDSKVVHTADMRKQASDVAGIEEVNAKQDKIGYTPADDSKVVHTTDTSNWQKSKVTNDIGMPLLMLGDTDDLSAKINILPNGYFTMYCSTKTLNNPSASPKRGIIHITASTRAGSGILFSEDKNAYIITMLSGTVTYTQIANDSKVAHLSGANNFDTTPTVNNTKLVTSADLSSGLATKADDSKVVHNTGDETIVGNKFFSSPIIGTLKTYEIKDGFDLNGYWNDSTFFINGAKNLVNYPTNASAFATLVVRAINTNTAIQTLTDSNGDIYVRVLGGNPATWGSWSKH